MNTVYAAGLESTWGAWGIPTKRATDEVLAMFGCDRVTTGLQILRERPGYSSEMLADNWINEDSAAFQQLRAKRAARIARPEAKIARGVTQKAIKESKIAQRKRLEADLCAALVRQQRLAATYTNGDRDFGDDHVVTMTVWSPCYRRARNAYQREYQAKKRTAERAASTLADSARKSFARGLLTTFGERCPSGRLRAQCPDCLENGWLEHVVKPLGL